MKSALKCSGKGESSASRGIRKGEGGCRHDICHIQHQAVVFLLRVGILSLNAVPAPWEQGEVLEQHPRMVRKKSHRPCCLTFPYKGDLVSRLCATASVFPAGEIGHGPSPW